MIEFIQPDYAPNGHQIYQVGQCIQLDPRAEKYYVDNHFAEYVHVDLNNAGIEGEDL